MATVDEAVAVADKIPGWMSVAELRWLANVASSRKLILEIGSWQGRSSKAMAMTVGERVYCVDPWYRASGEGLKLHPELPDADDNVINAFRANLAPELVCGKAVPIRMKSDKALAILKDTLGGRKLDMVFVDGDHTYEGVRDNVRDYAPLIARGGLLCGHDWNHDGWPGVVRAVKEFVPYHAVVNGTSIWMGII